MITIFLAIVSYWKILLATLLGGVGVFLVFFLLASQAAHIDDCYGSGWGTAYCVICGLLIGSALLYFCQFLK